MSVELLAALIAKYGIPEVARWLAHRDVDPITDAEMLDKLQVDADQGIAIGRAWLEDHPEVDDEAD